MERKLTVFLTGASGFLGSYLRRSLNSDKRVGVVYLFDRGGIEVENDKEVVLRGDLSEIEKYKKQLIGSDYVYHLAAIATFGSDEDYMGVNYLGTKSIVDLLRKEKDRRLKSLIFTSTIGAIDRRPSDDCRQPIDNATEPSPTSEYGRSKLKAERCLKKSGLPFTIIRPTWIYGLGMRQNSHLNAFVTLARKNSPVFRFNFPGKVSLIYVGDLVAAMVGCLENGKVLGKTYLAVGESLSLGEIFGIIYQSVNGRKVRQLPLLPIGFLVSWLHRFLPLTVSNLFINYLWAKDEEFKELLPNGNPKKLKDKVGEVVENNAFVNGYWVVTGANSGIGRALAKRLDEEGKRLVLIDRVTDNILAYDKKHLVWQCDLADRDSLKELVDRLAGIRIYALINNAGVGYKGLWTSRGWDELEKMIAVNMVAPVYLTNFLWKELEKNNGVVVNIGSSAGYHSLPGMSVYAATKSFVINWTEALAEESKKVRVVLFSPTGTATNFQKSAGVRSEAGQGLLSPAEVAEKICRSILSGKKHVIFGNFKSVLLVRVLDFLPISFRTKIQGWLFNKMR